MTINNYISFEMAYSGLKRIHRSSVLSEGTLKAIQARKRMLSEISR